MKVYQMNFIVLCSLSYRELLAREDLREILVQRVKLEVRVSEVCKDFKEQRASVASEVVLDQLDQLAPLVSEVTLEHLVFLGWMVLLAQRVK